MYRQVIEKAAEKMKKTTSVYQDDLRSIRAGRANPQFLERVTVDYYGVQTPLTQMGNITSPEPRMLVINVWDQKAIPMVEKAVFAGQWRRRKKENRENKERSSAWSSPSSTRSAARS